MPGKKTKAPKPKRVPHANETPLKALQPGHGAVERAKGTMWTGTGPPQGAAETTKAPASAAPAPSRPAYKPSVTMDIGMMGIGRGGGGKKKKVTTAASTRPREASSASTSKEEQNRGNPDSDFFGAAKSIA